MPIIFTKDSLRASVEAASGGKQTVLYDDKGYPSYMTIVPKFNIEDINTSLGTGVFPAFIVNGVEKSQIFVGTYQAIVADSRACSIPGQAPKNSMTFDAAKAACTAKGAGWHLMTAWEWAAIAWWCLKNGYQPRGNTDWRRSHEVTYETGTPTDGGVPGVASGEGRIMTGSGPASWRHDGTYQGISDLVGNVAEWQDGLKIIDGQIYVPNDNNFSLAESSWPATGVFFDSTGTTGDRNGSVANGAPKLSNSVSVYTETPTPAGGGDTGDFDYSYISGESGWRSMTLTTGYDSLALAVRQRMAQLLLSPKLASTDANPLSTVAKGAIWVRNYGERFSVRGGYWSVGSNAGLAYLGLGYRRSGSGGYIGLRPAFIL